MDEHWLGFKNIVIPLPSKNNKAESTLRFDKRSRSSSLKRMKDDASLDSFRSSLDANYEWPCLFPFKFIVPKKECQTVLDLFADDPVKANESSSGRFIAYTMEMNMHSSDEVIAIYQRVAQVPGVISL